MDVENEPSDNLLAYVKIIIFNILSKKHFNYFSANFILNLNSSM
jgi:hypothetical protein